MNSDNKQIRDVADVAARIMAGLPVTEKLHPNQQVLDVHEPEKDELTADDFKKLRAKKEVKKEEVEQMVQEREDDEYHTPSKHHVQVQVSKGDGQKTYRKATVRAKEPKHAVSAAIAHYKQQGYTVHDHKYLGEEVEQIDELSINTLTRVKGAATSAASDASREGDEGKATKRYDLAGKASNKIETKNRAAGLKPSGQHAFEEVEQIDELSKGTLLSYRVKSIGRSGEFEKKGYEAAKKDGGAGNDKSDKLFNKADAVASARKSAQNKLRKEEVESIDEVKMADLPSTKVQGRAYGASKPEPHALDLTKGPKDKELKNIDAEKKKKFSEMVNLYQDGGMKSFMEALSKEEEDEIIDEVSKEIADYTMDVIDAGEYTEVTIGEEASQDEFNAEIEKAKAKSQGKVKAEVAKAAVQAVKQEEVELGEDRMNDAEMEKREKIVKGMKKGLSGFKERYGDRAKNVMYATATKRAMEK